MRAISYKSPHVKVFQANILMRFTYDTTNGPKRLANAIKDSGANVVLLSESSSSVTAKVRDELNALGGTWFSINNSGDLGVITKYKIVDTSITENYTRATLNTGSGNVAVYSVHLDYLAYTAYLPRGYGGGARPGTITSEYGWGKIPGGPIVDTTTIRTVNRSSFRLPEINSVISDAENEIAKGHRIIVGGDFNEPSHIDYTEDTKNTFERSGVTYQWDVSVRMESAGYVDAYREKFSDPVKNPGITWPVEVPGVNVQAYSESGADVRDRIDFIYFKPQGLELFDVSMVGPSKTIRRNYGEVNHSGDLVVGSWASDHRAIFAGFTVV